MTPKQGQQVLVVFKNGVQLSGEVISWSDNKSILKSLSNASTIVINKTLDDVMFYKIFDYVVQQIDKIQEKAVKPEDIPKLAELKKQYIELEKAEIEQKLKTHQPDGLRKVEYGLPFINIKSEGAMQHTGSQVAQQDIGLGSELQKLFGKKVQNNRTGK